MEVTVRYAVRSMPNPFSSKKDRGDAYVICRETVVGSAGWREVWDSIPVAIFNLDSEAHKFATWVKETGVEVSLPDGLGISP